MIINTFNGKVKSNPFWWKWLSLKFFVYIMRIKWTDAFLLIGNFHCGITVQHLTFLVNTVELVNHLLVLKWQSFLNSSLVCQILAGEWKDEKEQTELTHFWQRYIMIYTVKPRKEEPRKLRTNRLFLKILYPLVKNQCQGVFEWMFLIKGY